ncbi:MAG TPA: hypothetical protein VGF36_16445 [Rhodopila sp.]
MDNVEISSPGVRGLSFSIADLTLIVAWSEACGLGMTIQLDHGSESDEFEEVVILRGVTGTVNRHFMWRDANTVFVQPLIGRTRRYASAAEAIAALTPRPAGPDGCHGAALATRVALNPLGNLLHRFPHPRRGGRAV